MPQFNELYATQAGVSDVDSNFDLNVLTDFRAKRFQESIDNNPYFFNGPFSGVAVQPAAYTFIYRFFANHSAENPAGQLTKSVLKSFFAISGPEDNLVCVSIEHSRRVYVSILTSAKDTRLRAHS
jgi:hypothetical protein